eukprot:5174082-Pyramimonas_sp.AAC.1
MTSRLLPGLAPHLVMCDTALAVLASTSHRSSAALIAHAVLSPPLVSTDVVSTSATAPSFDMVSVPAQARVPWRPRSSRRGG